MTAAHLRQSVLYAPLRELLLSQREYPDLLLWFLITELLQGLSVVGRVMPIGTKLGLNHCRGLRRRVCKGPQRRIGIDLSKTEGFDDRTGSKILYWAAVDRHILSRILE